METLVGFGSIIGIVLLWLGYTRVTTWYKILQIKIGQDYMLKGANPFTKNKVTVVDLKEGFVLFRHSDGMPGEEGSLDFTYKEEFVAKYKKLIKEN